MTLTTDRKKHPMGSEDTHLAEIAGACRGFNQGMAAWAKFGLEGLHFQRYQDHLQRVRVVSGLGVLAGVERVQVLLEASGPAKKTVRELNDVLPEGLIERRKKAPPKAVTLLERWKGVPSVDPVLLRSDNERLLDTSL